ncbi:lytic transglycosylase domain-containing protein [Paenibacillus sp. YN15]|uniref:lytic transglycosylase domain-containing protein n=1 Tax=Paenibacillus sp. YN15 TaxID=1742774 RepID=UPI000DCB428E|nr:lytic transglycosylase domain-containing protein [Paenibacillus sp. YN15]RAU99219.1 lytic transglycosylase domain-containing protein [Paenibacillus sp. YN15]
MSIDPSVLKQLLSLQMLQGTDTLTGSGQTNGTGTDFSELLQLLLGDSAAQSSSHKVIPAAELLARGKWSSAYPGNVAVSGQFSSKSAPADYEEPIQAASRRHGVEASLVKAVIEAESGYDSNAVSKAGAKGLMQLMDATGQGLGVANPFDAAQNIEGGTRYLSNLLRKYNGNEAVALAAYNAGPGRVDKLGIRNDADLYAKLGQLPKETQAYVSKVLGYKAQYEA